jgi:hypothetical protein
MWKLELKHNLATQALMLKLGLLKIAYRSSALSNHLSLHLLILRLLSGGLFMLALLFNYFGKIPDG